MFHWNQVRISNGWHVTSFNVISTQAACMAFVFIFDGKPLNSLHAMGPVGNMFKSIVVYWAKMSQWGFSINTYVQTHIGHRVKDDARGRKRLKNKHSEKYVSRLQIKTFWQCHESLRIFHSVYEFQIIFIVSFQSVSRRPTEDFNRTEISSESIRIQMQPSIILIYCYWYETGAYLAIESIN